MAVCKGLGKVEVRGGNLRFSVLKHKPKVGVYEIVHMILTTLLRIHQYTLFFQPICLEQKFKKIKCCRF